ARGAGRRAEPLGIPALRALGGGLLEAAGQARDHALPDHVELALAGLALPLDRVLAVAGAPQEQVAIALRQPAPRDGRVEAELLHDLAAEAVRPAGLLRDVLAPGPDRSGVDRERIVGHHQRGIDLHARAEPVAVDAHALGTVEREAL